MIWRDVHIKVEQRNGEPVIVFRWPTGRVPSQVAVGALWAALGNSMTSYYSMVTRMEDNEVNITVLRGASVSELVIPYSEYVDRRIVELIDVLAGIRCSVPQMVQLQLSLDDGGELERRLQVALPGVDA